MKNTDWNIKGFADSVLLAMHDVLDSYGGDIQAAIDDALDDYLRHEVTSSVYSKAPDDAARVTEEVREYINGIEDPEQHVAALLEEKQRVAR